ncbi:MAG: amidohydrolase family protein [Phycisphaerae bacterium]
MKLGYAVVSSIAILLWCQADACGQVAAFGPKTIAVGRCVAPDGHLKRNVVIELDQGKIRSVAFDRPGPDGGDGVSFPDAVVTAGLIDVRSQVGAFGNVVETVNSIDPDASAIDAIDWNHRDFRAAIRAGVTTVMVAPAPNNLVAGVAATVKTAQNSGFSPVLRDAGPMLLALGPSVWSYDRAPTSRTGSLRMLSDELDQAAAGGGSARLQSLVGGKLHGLVVCAEAMDVSSALHLFADRQLAVAIAYNGAEHDLGDELTRLASAVVVGPYSFSMTPHHLATAGVLAASGVPVAFSANLPETPAESLRMTAALAVRYGMDAAAARRAMTVTPALIAGVSNRVGSIHPGMDADLVIFSDDPLRLDARVLEVYVDGIRVFAASPAGITSTGASS